MSSNWVKTALDFTFSSWQRRRARCVDERRYTYLTGRGLWGATGGIETETRGASVRDTDGQRRNRSREAGEK